GGPARTCAPAPERRDDQRAKDRADDAARAQLEAVTGDEAEDEAADEGAHEPRDEGHPPVDASSGAAEDELRRRADEHPEEDQTEDQHAAEYMVRAMRAAFE